MPEPFIQASGLTKVFRRPVKEPGLAGALKHLVVRRTEEHVAVDGIDLAIEAGEAVAYVGRNGAGKSTTVKLLTGVLVPTSGQVRVAGVVPHENRIANARQIGVVFGQRTQLWWDLPVRETFDLLRDMYRIPQARYAQTLDRLIDILDLEPLLPVVARKLSLGQKMRADLAAALLHSPPIIYLDEPTIGLDIAVKDRVRAFLRQLVAEGTTVLLTTHDLDDIEDVCERIVIIDGGRIIHDGTLAAVKDELARDRSIHFQLAEPIALDAVRLRIPDAEVTAADITAADITPADITPADVEAGQTVAEFSVRFDRFEHSAGSVATAVMALGEVRDFRIDEPGIEDVVRKVYAGALA
jgi:ABC-2 type transport system ATP-binding protein